MHAVILATGYNHGYPFIEQTVRLSAKAGNIFTKELQYSCCSKACPNLFYLGMEDSFYTNNMFAAKAWFVRDIVLGRLDRNMPLRDTEGREWTHEDFVMMLSIKTTDKGLYELQGKVTECFMVTTGYGTEHVVPEQFVEGINNVFDEWIARKGKEILTYRNHAHRSAVTGNLAPVPGPKKDWMSNKWHSDIDFYRTLHR